MSRGRQSWLALKGALALALLACAAVAWTRGTSGQGKVELYASTGAGKLSAINEELKAYKTKLSHVLGKFDTLQARQSELRGDEQRLEAQERQVRSTVHQTRNAITTLQYKVHDMSTEALSNAMFGSRLSSTGPSARVSGGAAAPAHAAAAKAGAKARLATKASGALMGKAGAVVEPHATAPVPAVRVVSAVAPKGQERAAVVAPPKAAAAAAAAQPTALKAAVARVALARQQRAVQERRMELQRTAAQPQRAPWGALAARPAAALRQGGGDDEVQAAQARAAQAQRMAYMRSAEYVESQQRAAANRQRVYGTDLPQLPSMAPLGPEAAAP
eukprot:CAMPEP_0174917724 /NCGR_PEP_ID=MMETSP1355-20121228/2645_1 /TAXON_ID=464990 /ORGANISM="Hemiselmis tepida, Strain CCMP443" /LENGTH=330 /DNA_ID=CAMNT_0016162849 /DNA_START=9 /DNA_END=1001 /DNA_ORIENTATION=-